MDTYTDFQMCVGDPDTNNGTDHTSMMASRHKNHWCDDNTHIDSRIVDGIEVQNPLEDSSWTIAASNCPDLSGHTPGVYPTVDFDDLPPVECIFHFNVINDALLVVDHSGSMDHEDPDTGRLAVDLAVEAALGFYNSSEIDRFSGVLGFNTEVDTLIRYEEFDGDTLESLDVEPDGGTNISAGILAGAEMVHEANPDDAHGALILFSDGKPTSPCDDPPCSEEHYKQTVLDAAWSACSEGAYPV